MNNPEIQTNPSLKERALKSLGFSSTGLGAFGAAHNVCHYTCQAIVALLAVAGISIVGMPLGFLLDPYFIIAFSAIGLISIALSMMLHLRFLKLSGGRIVTDKKVIIAAVFGALSVFSLISGINDIRAGQQTAASVSNGNDPQSGYALAVDAPTKTNSEGTVDAALTFKGLSQEGLLFAVTLNTNDMSAPPLAEQYDLQELSYLIIDGKETAKPARWNVEETGHMGHHVQGTLLFPTEENGQKIITDQTESFEILIKNLGGVEERKFLWKATK